MPPQTTPTGQHTGRNLLPPMWNNRTRHHHTRSTNRLLQRPQQRKIHQKHLAQNQINIIEEKKQRGNTNFKQFFNSSAKIEFFI